MDVQSYASWALYILLAIGCLATIPAGFIILNKDRPKSEPVQPNNPAPTPEWKLPSGLEPEDLAWLGEQADLAEFSLPTVPRVRLPKPLELTGGTPRPIPHPVRPAGDQRHLVSEVQHHQRQLPEGSCRTPAPEHRRTP